MRLCAIFVLLFASSAIYSQDLPNPLTQVEACGKFERSVVRVDTDTMHGTGFIVGSDGWIVTALHVVADKQTLAKYENISISMLNDPHSIPAEIVSKLDSFARVRDFAILKIDKSDLPALDLGDEVNIKDGSPIAIIGLPLSAAIAAPLTSIPRFCLSGTVAAQTALPLGNLAFLHTVFFQGVSIKGISGAPIISLDTGKVIGIVSTKLTGISNSLSELREKLKTYGTGGVAFSGIGDPGAFALNVTEILDAQLANGLGSGTGAADAANELKEIQRGYQKPR
jgi:S1-C subfamily serine protease